MYSKICNWENLYLAFKAASKGKRRLWYVAEFEHNLEENLFAIREELEQKNYRPLAYQSFYIHEPKKRLISAAHFRDRVVHHALYRVIQPMFERSFICDSYANRRQKGTHRALNRCQQFARKYQYVLQCDVRQFFPSIDHDILMAILQKKSRIRMCSGFATGLLPAASASCPVSMTWFTFRAMICLPLTDPGACPLAI